MKTTLDIDDDLLMEAKMRAVELRRPLRWLVSTALRAELDRGADRKSREKPAIEWVTAEGGLPADLDASDRAAMGDWIMRARQGS